MGEGGLHKKRWERGTSIKIVRSGITAADILGEGGTTIEVVEIWGRVIL